MFDVLSEKFSGIFHKLGNKGRLTEKDVEEALKEVRIALLEADVNFKVTRDFTTRIRERAIGSQILSGLNPGAQVVKLVHEEMREILTAGNHKLLSAPNLPTTVMLVGLQGSGKTTTAAKLSALLERSNSHKSLLLPLDFQRPAAVEQLSLLANQINAHVYLEENRSSVVTVAANGLNKARQLAVQWLIVDTAGRLHVDQELMSELEAIKRSIMPQEILLVVDAMTGQDAVRVAQEFHDRIDLTGIILTKLDGDARGGAALSISAVTGIPVKFIGLGEKIDNLESFYPDRMASRILGMGDVLSLAEKAQNAFDLQQTQEIEKKLKRATFDLQDFLEQLRALQRMGPLGQVMEMIPGFSTLKRQVSSEEMEDGKLKKIESIILSMTDRERHSPEILNGSRRRRIAQGSGTTVQDINQLLNQFRQIQKLMKQMSKTKGRGLKDLLKI
ncbi:signal recognition particle protein [SAR202 cluster bacterium AD-802-E10_MRT_200m]|nr:signal recognition particle protein [SAR202 cluster bacterium AD-802-E10_MRT_200m]